MNDDTLILYYYRDGLSEAERRRVEASLEADAPLRARYDALCNDLARLDAPEPVAVPADMTVRWHDSIDSAARSERQRAKSPGRGFHFPSFAWGTGVTAALLVAGIVIGIYISDNQVSEPLVVDNDVTEAVLPDAGAPSDAFARGLKVYLRESRQELAGLPTDAERTLLIMQMIGQNRMFERAAEQNDAEDLARVLRAFEFILVRLASDDITAEDAQALQSQLAFELDVMLTKLGRNTSDVTDPI